MNVDPKFRRPRILSPAGWERSRGVELLGWRATPEGWVGYQLEGERVFRIESVLIESGATLTRRCRVRFSHAHFELAGIALETMASRGRRASYRKELVGPLNEALNRELRRLEDRTSALESAIDVLCAPTPGAQPPPADKEGP